MKPLMPSMLTDRPLDEYQDAGLQDKVCIVKDALASHLASGHGERLKSLGIVRVFQRPFSDVAILRLDAGKESGLVVMKTTKHHPVNRHITEKENQAVVEYGVISELYPKFKAVEGCSVPRPILVIPEIETYVMEYVEGNLLAVENRFVRLFSSREGFATLKEYYYLCGKWLKNFQQFTGFSRAGLEAVQAVIERCDYRLRLVEDANSSCCPKGLRKRVMGLLTELQEGLPEDAGVVSGRHGDFGAWNMLAGEKGITVIDFLGYSRDLMTIDILKMLVAIENEKESVTSSRHRVEALRDRFIEGYGQMPVVLEPVLIITEALHRICSVLNVVTNKAERFHHHIEGVRSLKTNLKWLLDDRHRRPLWPCG